MSAALVASLLLLAGCSGGSGDGSEIFAGKTITILAPFAPGGVSDVTARLVAEELPDLLPGKPEIIVKNVPGGGGSVAMQQVATQLPADGLTIVSATTGVVFRHLLKEAGHDYPLESMPLVGALPNSVVTAASEQVGDIAALRNSPTPVLSGSTSAGAHASVTEYLEAKILGFPLHQVFGYEGYGPVGVAIQSGEVNMASPGDLSYVQSFGDLAEAGELRPLFQSGLLNGQGAVVRSTLVPDVPTVDEVVADLGIQADPAMTAAMKTCVDLATLGTSLLVREGTPEPYLTALTAAFEQMGSSDSWRESTEKAMGVALPTLNASDAKQALQGVLQAPDGVVSTLEEIAREQAT